MRDQLKAYIDRLFEGTVQNGEARDFHDELLQNTLDRFDEEQSNGRSEQEAYRIAVLSLGNTEELLKPFYPKRQNTNALRTAGIILYVTSVIPVILLGAMDVRPSTLGVTLMILMCAAATMLMILSGRAKPTAEAERARMLRSAGVAMIIASVSAVLLGAGYEEIRLIRLLPVDGAVLGVCGMFCLIAGGIALLVTAGQKDHARTVPQVPVTRDAQRGASEQAADGTASSAAHAQNDAPAAPEMRPAVPKGLRIAGGILTAVYWILAVMVFFSVSFTTGAWYYSWLVFVFASGVYNIVSGVVRLCCGLSGVERIIDGVLDIGAGAAFYALTAATGAWWITWLVFLIEACLHGIIKQIFRLARTSGKENVA